MRRISIVATSLLAASVLTPLQANAHGAGSQGQARVPGVVHLKHRQPADMIALFGREELPKSGHLPRSASAESEESLLPDGIDALVRSPDGKELEIVGAQERIARLREMIEELDAPVESVAPDRARVTLTLRHADPHLLRGAVLKLPEAGTAAAEGRQLKLEGKPEWLHHALRLIIRAELGEGAPAPGMV